MIYNKIIELRNTKIRKKIDKRLGEFTTKNKKSNKYWFSELCFCILTANSRAITAIKIQEELGPDGFLTKPQEQITKTIRGYNHRFHNNKAKYIVEARKYHNIKDIIKAMNQETAREFIVKNIKGLGYKESSHFLRNVGYFNLAILDRHIINLMVEDEIIRRPKTLNKKNYIKIEKTFKKLAKSLSMSCAELDLYMWYMKTGEILK